MKLMRIGVDLAKNVFQIHGVDRHEQPIWRQRLPRDRWLQTVLEKIEPGCEIGMDSCGGAHHWARQLQARGFRVRLIAPQFVKPTALAYGPLAGVRVALIFVRKSIFGSPIKPPALRSALSSAASDNCTRGRCQVYRHLRLVP
jgi:hypothetical protein